MTDKTDDSPTPNRQADDLEFAGRLGAVARFNPRPGFGLRVLSQVRHPLPRWVRRGRAWLLGMVTGVRGWVVLGSLSLAAAAAWGLAIATGIRFSSYVAEGFGAAMSALAPLWQEWVSLGVGGMRTALAALAESLEIFGLSWQAVTISYGALTIVSAVALWRLMARPSRVRNEQ